MVPRNLYLTSLRDSVMLPSAAAASTFPLPLPSLQLPRMRTHRPPTDHCLSSHRPHLTPPTQTSLTRHSPTNLVPLPLSHFISLFQRGRRASWSAAAPPPTTPSSKLYPISSTRPSSPRYVRLLCHVSNGKRSPGGFYWICLRGRTWSTKGGINGQVRTKH